MFKAAIRIDISPRQPMVSNIVRNQNSFLQNTRGSSALRISTFDKISTHSERNLCYNNVNSTIDNKDTSIDVGIFMNHFLMQKYRQSSEKN